MKRVLIFITLLWLCHFSSAVKAQTITNTKDSGAGSLRQAIIDANNGVGDGNIVFNIPTTDPNFNVERGVFEIYIQSSLPEITRNKVSIDGSTQTAFTGNTNNIELGSGGTVGIDALTLNKVSGPEIEIIGKKSVPHGLRISGEAVTVKGLAIYGFSSGSVGRFANIVLLPTAQKAIITQNIIGSYADSLTEPTSNRSGGSGITGESADSIQIVNNIVAYNEVGGIYLFEEADFWLIEGNEVISNGLRVLNRDGIDLSYSRECKVIGNKLVNNQAFGIDTYFTEGYHVIENNTVTHSGLSEKETAGIRVYGQESQISKNIISQNYGAGILITSGASKNLISKNSFYENGDVLSGSGSAATAQIGIDLLKSNEDHKVGKAPYFTLNDASDHDIGGNGLLNFPVLASAIIKEGNLTIEGWVGKESEVELYLADSQDKEFPQGKTYLLSFVEGSVNDTDATTSQYGPGLINGIAQGTDETSRFQISLPLPSGVSEGTSLTATATLNGATSEFAARVVVTEELTSVKPIAGCLIANADNTYSVSLGYSNPNTTAIQIELGENNAFSDQSSFQGHPTSFEPGYHENVFTATFGSEGISWNLDSNVLVIDNTIPLCQTNIHVSAAVSEAFVNYGDTAIVYFTAKNTSNQATNGVELSAVLPASVVLIAHQQTQGNYDAATGVWQIGALSPGDSAILEIHVKVTDETELEALLISLSQVDSNELDNSAIVSIGLNTSTGGEEGGIESNGNLATKIATRNFRKFTSDASSAREAKVKFVASKVKSGKIKAAGSSSRTKATVTPLDFIPENGPSNTEAFVTTPSDLLGITNASTVFAVDYLNTNEQRLGAILAITTENSLYEHTKVICDRLNGAELENIWHTEVKGKPYIMFKLKQPGEEVDYAINFIVKNNGASFVVDNRWGLEEYDIEGSDEIFNMQIWSKSPEFTEKLLADFIANLEKKENTAFLNNYPPTIPLVYVKSGKYKNGQIQLVLSNPVEATDLSVRGSSAEVEDGSRSNFLFDLSVSSKTEGSYEVNLPVDYVFDAGFSIQNDIVGGSDILYFADGPWGVDYEKGGAEITDFQTQQYQVTADENTLPIERNALMEGQVTTYASLFRYLRPGLLPMNLNQHNQLTFAASGTGNYEVILLKKSVNESAKQFRKYITLDNTETEFTIDYAELTDRNGNGKGTFKADDVVAIVFNALGNQQTQQSFNIEVKNVAFRTNAVTGIEDEIKSSANILKVIPNPFDQQATLIFHLKGSQNKVKLEVFDVLGNKILNLLEGNLTQGFYEIPVDGKTLKSGMYIARLTVNGKVFGARIVRQ